MRQALRIFAAAAWAFICMVIAAVVLAVVCRELFDGVTGHWQWLPVIGEFAILMGVGVAAFTHAMRGSAQGQKRSSAADSANRIEVPPPK